MARVRDELVGEWRPGLVRRQSEVVVGPEPEPERGEVAVGEAAEGAVAAWGVAAGEVAGVDVVVVAAAAEEQRRRESDK
jgi:hypothetical protein